MSRKRALRVYIWLLTGVAVGIVAVSVLALTISPPTDPTRIGEAVVLAGLGWFCSQHRVHFAAGSSSVSLGSIAFVASLIILPLPLAITVCAAAKAASEGQLLLQGKRRSRAALVNVSLVVTSSGAAGAVFALMRGPDHLFAGGVVSQVEELVALISLSLVCYMVDAALVSGAITLNCNESYLSVVRQVTRDAALPEISLLGLGVLLALLARQTYILTPIVVVPVLLSVRSFGAVARLREETEGAVKHMAESIDIRDTGTGDHSKRLEDDARRLAAALKLTAEHVHDVGLAARTHDLGKIGISNTILLKDGPLTPEERAIMEEHPVIGADILASYSAFAKSVTIVRHHHERWDGKGYPDGLKGEEIPIGSRIIAVVDAYDAMTSDRPYRKGMQPADAVERLKGGMGSQFDPAVCAAWIQILIDDGIYTPDDAGHHLRLVASARRELTG